MELRISDDDLRLIGTAHHALFLGIITAEGVVRLTESDPAQTPGHVEWLEREPMEDVVRGFSLLVKEGRVYRLFRLSRLNPTADATLEGRLVSELEGLIPRADDYGTFGD